MVEAVAICRRGGRWGGRRTHRSRRRARRRACRPALRPASAPGLAAPRSAPTSPPTQPCLCRHSSRRRVACSCVVASGHVWWQVVMWRQQVCAACWRTRMAPYAHVPHKHVLRLLDACAGGDRVVIVKEVGILAAVLRLEILAPHADLVAVDQRCLADGVPALHHRVGGTASSECAPAGRRWGYERRDASGIAGEEGETKKRKQNAERGQVNWASPIRHPPADRTERGGTRLAAFRREQAPNVRDGSGLSKCTRSRLTGTRYKERSAICYHLVDRLRSQD